MVRTLAGKFVAVVGDDVRSRSPLSPGTGVPLSDGAPRKANATAANSARFKQSETANMALRLIIRAKG